jgi:hypothetical protein
MATLALLLSLIANFSCLLVKFDPAAFDNLATFHFGLFSYSKLTSVAVSFTNSQVTAEGECSPYDDSVDFDGTWRAARAFAIIATIIGGVVVIGMWLVLCLSRHSTENFWNLAILLCLLVLPFCQGLTFLILRSELCKDNPVLELLGGLGLYSDQCELDTGGMLNIVATIVWFLAGLLVVAIRDKLY